MYAVISTGGKQYKVSPGDTIRVEKITGEPGTSVTFDQVLMVSDEDSVRVGQPTLPDAKVDGHIVEQGRAKKVLVMKYKRRKGYHRKHGHRQYVTALKIDSIQNG
jgi:large subunit ribosomal protein L21